MDATTPDLIVLGAGIAGLSTATSAAELGLDVLLIEKTGAIGGSSAMSGGWFAFTGTEEQRKAGVQDSRELFLKDLLEVGSYQNDQELLRAYLENQYETYQWLKECGVHFRALEISSGQSVPRGHNTLIVDVLKTLHQRYTGLGGKTRFNTRAQSLVRDEGGSVIGIRVEDADGSETINALSGVVIASGGFSRSKALLSIFAPEQLEAIPYGGRENTGDGLRMAWKIGAGLADMSAISGTYGSHPDTSEEQHELLTSFYMGGIIVNTKGERFIDESVDYKTLGAAVLKEPDALAYQIFDASVRAKSQRGIALKDMDSIEDLGHIFKADSIEELAAKAELPAAELAQTITSYNEIAAGRQADSLGRESLCNGAGKLTPVLTAPFYAYPAKTLMTTTYGGVTVTPFGEVTDVDGAVVDGLYAVGEVVGGFHGAAYMTGTSLGKGAVFGRIVARRVRSAAKTPIIEGV